MSVSKATRLLEKNTGKLTVEREMVVRKAARSALEVIRRQEMSLKCISKEKILPPGVWQLPGLGGTTRRPACGKCDMEPAVINGFCTSCYNLVPVQQCDMLIGGHDEDKGAN